MRPQEDRLEVELAVESVRLAMTLTKEDYAMAAARDSAEWRRLFKRIEEAHIRERNDLLIQLRKAETEIRDLKDRLDASSRRIEALMKDRGQEDAEVKRLRVHIA
jgi:chromosome segregation ATPase